MSAPTIPGDVLRLGLAAALDIEADMIAATTVGSPERRQLVTRWLSSRPNDNEHVASARRIVRMLRDGEPVKETVVGSRYYRRAFIDLLPSEEPTTVETPRIEPARVTVAPQVTPPISADELDPEPSYVMTLVTLNPFCFRINGVLDDEQAQHAREIIRAATRAAGIDLSTESHDSQPSVTVVEPKRGALDAIVQRATPAQLAAFTTRLKVSFVD